MALTSVPVRPARRTARDVARYCTAAEKRALLGELDPIAGSRAQHERDACRVLGIPYHQRRIPLPGGRGHTHVDECEIWIDGYVRALLDVGRVRAA